MGTEATPARRGGKGNKPHHVGSPYVTGGAGAKPAAHKHGKAGAAAQGAAHGQRMGAEWDPRSAATGPNGAGASHPSLVTLQGPPFRPFSPSP